MAEPVPLSSSLQHGAEQGAEGAALCAVDRQGMLKLCPVTQSHVALDLLPFALDLADLIPVLAWDSFSGSQRGGGLP